MRRIAPRKSRRIKRACIGADPRREKRNPSIPTDTKKREECLKALWLTYQKQKKGNKTMNINKVVLTGNLVKEPDAINLPSGKMKCSFRIAVNGYNDHTDFFGIVVFENIAESCNKYLKKGSRVGVDGRLTTREFDGKDGQKRTITEIVADNVEFLFLPKSDDQDEKPSQAPQYKQDKMGGLPPVDPVDDDDLPF